MAKYRVTSPEGVTFEVTAPDDATPDQVQAYAQQNMPKASPADAGFAALKQNRQNTANEAGGLIRGAGSIGATLMAPGDMLEDFFQRRLTGKPTEQSRNDKRRQGIDDGLTSLIGSDPTSGRYQAAKVIPEIAGTMGVGGAAAGVASGVAPNLAARVPAALEAVRTAGMSAGGATGATGLGLRTAGGAVNGALAAGLVDPSTAGQGALIGGAAPGAFQLAGKAGNAAGRLVRGPEQAPEVTAALQQARGAGYVIPPSQVKPSLVNRTIEGISGKLTTAQNASAQNQAVTNKLAARSVGLADDVPLTVEALDGVRAEAGQAYAAISKLGKFDATGVQLPKDLAVETGISPLLAGKTKSVDAAELVRAWKQSNADATAYYRAYGRDANPETLAKAKAAAGNAKQIDDFMTKRVAEIEAKRPDKLIADFVSGKMDQADFIQQSMVVGSKKKMTEALKEARVRIAKTYSVESAMNPVTGTVDARKLAKQLEKGKMLSGDLLTAGQFAALFPKAAQTVEGMGSLPQTSPLDWIPAVTGSVATGNPFLMAGVMARPAIRAAALSGPVQNRLAQRPPNDALANLLANPDLQQAVLRAAPNALNGR